jgi:hypothetical protein
MSDLLAKELVIHAAPSLLGIKPANLINLDYKEEIKEDLCHLISNVNKKICFRILKIKNGKALVLIYHKNLLNKCLNEKMTKEFLNDMNYVNCNNINEYLDILSRRINNNLEFPHEIGVFLGYDLYDIKHFIKNDLPCIYTGYWKVYSKLDEKLETFKKYDYVSNYMKNLFDKGYNIEKLLN